MTQALLRRAVYKNPAFSVDGVLERLFAHWFYRFVYNQIWEDPVVDIEALAIGPDSRVATISSGGCNVMNMLLAGPWEIIAVDLNPCHLHLARLKLAAARHLPGHEDFYAMFGTGAEAANLDRYHRHLAPHLDDETRDYWDRSGQLKCFRDGLYRHSLLGRFIGFLHASGRLVGCDPAQLMKARSVRQQRELFEEHIAPCFDHWAIRAAGKLPFILYSLGIPPTQVEALREAGQGDLIAVLRERVRKLACDFPLADNYFAWQAFGRTYDHEHRRALPDYLRAENFDTLRANAHRVHSEIATMTDALRRQPAGSIDGVVLLDAQDWMDNRQLAELWTEIVRAGRPGGRVVFRTAGLGPLLPGRLPADLLARLDYHAEDSAAWGHRDRSAIYGGFHLYTLRP